MHIHVQVAINRNVLFIKFVFFNGTKQRIPKMNSLKFTNKIDVRLKSERKIHIFKGFW